MNLYNKYTNYRNILLNIVTINMIVYTHTSFSLKKKKKNNNNENNN